MLDEVAATLQAPALASQQMMQCNTNQSRLRAAVNPQSLPWQQRDPPPPSTST